MGTKPAKFLTLGWAAISWIETYLVHGPGDVQGQPIELDDEFAAFILKAYRVAPKTGARLIRRAFLSRAKGRSKSGLAAFVACFEALGPCRFDHFAQAGEVSDWGYEYEVGEPVGKPLIYAEVLNVATEEDQAGNTYDAIFYALNPETCSDLLRQDFPGLDVGLTRINLPGSRGFIEPVTSADSSKDGAKSTFIVADETHLWVLPRLKRLHGVMTRNLLKRKVASGWMLETSTMYGQGEGSVAEGTHLYAQSAGRGTRERPLLFDHVEAAESWDLPNRTERIHALAEAYGPAAAWMNLEAIADSWDDPQVTEAEFRRYWLNQPVPMAAAVEVSGVFDGRWLTLADVKAERGPRPVFAVSVAPDRSWSAVAVAWVRTDGAVQVMLADYRPSTDWVAARVAELRGTWGGTVVASTTARGLVPGAVEPPQGEQALAHTGLDDAVTAGTVRHGNEPALNTAVRGARWKAYGDTRQFDRKGSLDISPLDAAALAVRQLTSGQSSEPRIRTL